jgi:hypothetical protein
LTFSKSFEFGNLEFPRRIDFLSARAPAEEEADGSMKMGKSFLVETAEYVTTQGRQYAQTFILEKPVLLKSIDLALHKFGDDGQLWIELFADDNGRPGEHIATSDIVLLKGMAFIPGYDWVPFDFGGAATRLPPGRYWAALGFTGSPIVNWFFTYGKPVGPKDGTRYKLMFDTEWSRSLNFEFNYRVTGLSAG